MNVNSPPAVGRNSLTQNNKSSAESGLVPVLQRIKAVPENMYARFDALCLYALGYAETISANVLNRGSTVYGFNKTHIILTPKNASPNKATISFPNAISEGE